MRMAYLCRCDSLKRSGVAVVTHTQQSKGTNMVTGSVECDICEKGTQREEFSLQNERTDREQDSLRENRRRNVWYLKHHKTKIILICFACKVGQEDHQHTPGGFIGTHIQKKPQKKHSKGKNYNNLIKVCM